MPRKWNFKIVLCNIILVLFITALLIPLSDLRWRDYAAALFLVSAAGGVLALGTGIVLLLLKKRNSSRSFLLSAVLLLTYSLLYFFSY